MSMTEKEEECRRVLISSGFKNENIFFEDVTEKHIDAISQDNEPSL